MTNDIHRHATLLKAAAEVTMTNDIHRHATLLKAAARAAKNITTILDPYELLQRTVDIICDEFGFYYAGVFLLDDLKQYAVLKAGRGEAGKTMINGGHKLAIGGNSMIGASIANRQGRIALDVGAEAVFFENPHLPKTRSEMALPLVVGDEAIGALTVQSTEEAAFHDEDIAALQTMADQLAIAIQNSNLHRQAERRSRLLKAANRVGKEVTSILDLETLLPHTVNIICEAYGLYYAGVFLLDDAGEYAVLRAGYGKAGKAMVADGHKLKVGTDSMIGACIAMSEARIALDVGEERCRRRARAFQESAFAAHPLRNGAAPHLRRQSPGRGHHSKLGRTRFQRRRYHHFADHGGASCGCH